MLLFCPSCQNVLTVQNATGNRLVCRTCPYSCLISEPIYSRQRFEAQEKEDVFGGPGAWDHAQKTDRPCPQDGCDGSEAAFYQVQIRSADEPMTSFMRCTKCGHRWREN